MKRKSIIARCVAILFVMIGLAGHLAWNGGARYRLRRSLSGQVRNAPCQPIVPAKRTLFPVYPNKFIDRNGNVVLELEADLVENFTDGLALVWQHGEHGWRHGFVDSTGRWVIAPRFTEAFNFSEGLAFVSDEQNHVGYIDRTGRMVINTDETVASDWSFSECRTAVWTGSIFVGGRRLHYGKWGYIDHNGALVIAPQFERAEQFKNGQARVQDNNGKWGVIDYSGQFIIKPQFDYAGQLSENRASVGFYDFGVHSARYGYIDRTGNQVIGIQFDGARDFSEGLACVIKGNKIGYIDHSGTFVIEPKFDTRNANEYQIDAEDFSEGLAAVRLGGKWGYIDRTGKIVIPSRYEIVTPFSGGLALVREENGGPEIYIDQTGRIVWPRQEK